jgi:hypothetical protein
MNIKAAKAAIGAKAVIVLFVALFKASTIA